MKVILRLLVVAIIIVGIGWGVMSLVKFPGNVANLQKYSSTNYETVSQVNFKSVATISQTSYELTDFNSKSAEYTSAVDLFKSNLDAIQIKADFSWDEEKEIKSEMKAVYKIEKQVKEYLSSLILYLDSSELHAETAQNMINNSTSKFADLAQRYNQLDAKLQNYKQSTQPQE